jgi:hypothetical protein
MKKNILSPILIFISEKARPFCPSKQAISLRYLRVSAYE